ncbi:type II secretion system protein [Clostridium cochlearium]|uniref:Type IV pilus assembly protein PilA n=1 Tax=Clostridium cochlearium TaxID=1494 RepID=A0ABY0QKP0_CLOCO|nr:type II secretion system protein [Clostridium cochlearium]NSJ92085.1 type II secretion system protein [Coprococcus sp. MSK.21.13]SDL07504.1 type IV pilus assembly protein PilA [Clostridium cochlearium]SNV79991.1 putative type IV pilin [Clostridium cochlearium]STA92809.1 putative type IV pilin [Clostridium cochlearium]
MKSLFREKNKGFTLVELLVVMTIILILIGFMVPKIGGYRTKANKLKAENCAKQIYTAAMCSYGETNGKFNGDNLKETIKLLLGENTEENIIVGNVSDDEAIVTFTIDDKEYSMNINKDDYILGDK